MAYGDTVSGGSRVVGLTTVVISNVAFIMAFALGMKIEAVTQVLREVQIIEPLKDEVIQQIEAPPPAVEQQVVPPPVYVPELQIDVPIVTKPSVVKVKPQKAPPPKRVSKPTGHWRFVASSSFRDSDYPARAKAMGQEGVVTVRYTVVKGRATNCTVISNNTGSSLLARKTCSVIERRFRWRKKGKPRSLVRTQPVRWQIKDK